MLWSIKNIFDPICCISPHLLSLPSIFSLLCLCSQSSLQLTSKLNSMKSQAGSPVLPKLDYQLSMEVRAQELQQRTSPEVLDIFCSGQFWQKSGDFTLLFD